MTTWRPVYLRQVHWAGGSGPVPVYECGACSLEKILSRRPAVSVEEEIPEKAVTGEQAEHEVQSKGGE